MCFRSVLFVVLVTAILCISNCEELESTTTVQDLKSNNAQTNSTTNDDKNFWEWLYGLIGPRPPAIVEPADVGEPEKPEKCSPCSCGIANKENRIVGGVQTLVNQYPWMAVMMYRGRFYCGATVINTRYVLTASHCVDRFDANLITVRILEHDRNSTTEAETQEFKVESVMKHSGYSTYNYNNDIALVKLKSAIKFVGKMRPVCLPEQSKTFAGMNGIVTGWGAVAESGSISQVLQEVMVPILTNAECRATKYPARRITDNMLCAGYKEGSKDSCQGDSGGPLHILNDNVHHIVGVVSWGEGCAKPNYPGVYARVNRYLTWIERNTKDGCYC